MTDTLQKLAEASEGQEKPFQNYEEEAIILLGLDHPEFFTGISRFLQPTMFNRVECQWIVAEILNVFEKHGVVPTRNILRDKVMRSFTEDDPYEPILEIINKKSDPREIPVLKDMLLRWTQDKAYGLLFSDDAEQAYSRGDYNHLEEILQQANRIGDVGQRGFWFFDNYQRLFEPELIEHRTTGFRQLDQMLNNGGPSPKEVVCWMAGTNVGKCLTLDTAIFERENSRVYQIQLEDDRTMKLPGYMEVQTDRGPVKVKHLVESDDILDMPTHPNL